MKYGSLYWIGKKIRWSCERDFFKKERSILRKLGSTGFCERKKRVVIVEKTKYCTITELEVLSVFINTEQ